MTCWAMRVVRYVAEKCVILRICLLNSNSSLIRLYSRSGATVVVDTLDTSSFIRLHSRSDGIGIVADLGPYRIRVIDNLEISLF